jgi:D-alanyl-lipoteichoic acid acyltransferase DltB (MBOAT superfamily)
MLFNSFEFAVFLPIAFVGFHLLRRLTQRRPLPWQLWLILVSCFFYGCWKPWYLILIAISTVSSYAFGLAIHPAEGTRRRRLMWASIAVDLALLGTFKYGNFLLANLEAAARLSGTELGLPHLPTELPVGISFYTFQTLSYTIDLARKRVAPARSLREFAVYVTFFPQLVAGPIVRAKEFLPQLAAPPHLSLSPKLQRATVGAALFLILAGLAKKMIIADTLLVTTVQPFFASPQGHSALETLGVLWAANFQVYCDFSGYTDVATGAALLFGFQLPLNFNRPFWSRTPMEHWRRWHITLSTWLRDYLYFPLGGSKTTRLRTHLNLIITFLLGGLWHGAGWTFVFWGLYNGVLLVLWREFLPREAKTRLGVAIQVIATFHAICFGLIFLHAHSFADAWIIFGGLARWTAQAPPAFSPLALGMLALAITLHATPQRWKAHLQAGFAQAPAWSLGAITVATAGVLNLFSGFASPFFYFQF